MCPGGSKFHTVGNTRAKALTHHLKMSSAKKVGEVKVQTLTSIRYMKKVFKYCHPKIILYITGRLCNGCKVSVILSQLLKPVNVQAAIFSTSYKQQRNPAEALRRLNYSSQTCGYKCVVREVHKVCKLLSCKKPFHSISDTRLALELHDQKTHKGA